MAVFQPRDTERGWGKKRKRRKKRDATISAQYKRGCGFVMYGTLQTQLLAERELLQYSMKDKEVILRLRKCHHRLIPLDEG